MKLLTNGNSAEYDFMRYIKNIEKELDDEELIIFSEYSKPFMFATENLIESMQLLKLKSRDCLSITSSGDHLINLALNGVRSVDCFDINHIAYYFTKLKIAGLKILTREEFINYFCSFMDVMTYCNDRTYVPLQDNNAFFDKKIYEEKIRLFLDENTKTFFDLLYNYVEINKININKLIHSACKTLSINNNLYLKDDLMYQKARLRLFALELSHRIRFYQADVFELSKLDSKYDYVFLSNISTYLNDQESYCRYIKKDLKNILNRKGQILTSYHYSPIRNKNKETVQSLKVFFKSIIKDSRYSIERHEWVDGTISKEFPEVYIFPCYHMDVNPIRNRKMNGYLDTINIYRKK